MHGMVVGLCDNDEAIGGDWRGDGCGEFCCPTDVRFEGCGQVLVAASSCISTICGPIGLRRGIFEILYFAVGRSLIEGHGACSGAGVRRDRIESDQHGLGIACAGMVGRIEQTVGGHDTVLAASADPRVPSDGSAVQMDELDAKTPVANLSAKASGYDDPNDLDGKLFAAKVDVKKGPFGMRLGYSKVSDNADIIAPWRGFPTGSAFTYI